MSTHHPRPSISLSHPQSSSAALATRVTTKRAELASLLQLRDLSAQLATQMAELESKLSTLRDGAESVAAVMENWRGVLGVIGMAGKGVGDALRVREGGVEDEGKEGMELPGTLVRIPVGVEVNGGGGKEKEKEKDNGEG